MRKLNKPVLDSNICYISTSTPPNGRMSWLIHCWLLVSLLMFKGCQNLFLRHTDSGKCITSSEELVFNNPTWALPYFVVMTDNCLNVSAQFRYLDSALLHNIEKEGSLVSTTHSLFLGRLSVYKAVAATAILFQDNARNRLKQTDSGSLFFYDTSQNVCAEPSTKYVLRNATCDTENQKFSFGSVTAYNAEMKDVHCSPKQKMVVKSADYGDFNKNGVFNDDQNIDTTCSKLTNCQVKSLCGGNRSCEMTIDNNLLPSQYCSDTSKDIYTEYTCVDTYNSTIITSAPMIRLTFSPYRGYIEIKNGTIWRRVKEENWDKYRQKMLCQHLGFDETDANKIVSGQVPSGSKIVTGDLICYNTQPSGTSCCVHLQPSTTTSNVKIPYATCKICDNPILQYSNPIFSGNGSREYTKAWFSFVGWCASGSAPYLSIDLRKEYHITRVVTMGDKDQTKWSGSYSMRYSRDKRLVDGSSAMLITGNKNGYQASKTNIDIYNARHIKIQSTVNKEFCLRIELCGVAQTPATAYDIKITPSHYLARVTWKLQTSASSYITQIIIYLDGNQHWTISRGTQFDITGLKPGTMYTVRIQTQDGSSQTSSTEDRNFKTNKAEPVNPVAISYSSLNVTIAKPPTYFKDVMVVVQIATKNPTPVEDIKTSHLKPYQTDTQAPYITAYLKVDVLPLSFVIGDGKQYNFENKNYLNQPLKQNSTYIVFLRFFESQDSHYSTEWSSSVKTLLKPPGLSGPPLDVTLDSRSKNSLEVSWKAPDESLQNGELTGYQVCFYSKDTASECLMFKSAKVLSLTLNNLLPSMKYFVTVSASTKAGYGEKSAEVSKITSGDPVNPLTASYYTLILNIPKAEDYIREVMVIVQTAKSSSTPSENLKTGDLKSYEENMNNPYVTAYLKADVLPLTFVVGDGKEYNSEKENYFNQPLKLSSSYIVFLRFFESQGSYYSTAWSSNVRTLIKAPVDNNPNTEQSNKEKTRMDLIVPLAILALCFLLSLGVIIYQRRLIQNNNRQGQENRKDPPRSNKAAPRNSYVNDDAVYETPDDVIQCMERNEAESKPEISTGQESSAYMSLKNNRDPANFYQSLQPPGRSVYPHHTKRSNVQAMEYENPAFNANFSGD